MIDVEMEDDDGLKSIKDDIGGNFLFPLSVSMIENEYTAANVVVGQDDDGLNKVDISSHSFSLLSISMIEND